LLWGADEPTLSSLTAKLCARPRQGRRDRSCRARGVAVEAVELAADCRDRRCPCLQFTSSEPTRRSPLPSRAAAVRTPIVLRFRLPSFLPPSLSFSLPCSALSLTPDAAAAAEQCRRRCRLSLSSPPSSPPWSSFSVSLALFATMGKG
jgi:hypothetical protein